ncbi:3522_t:CDS:2 [Paraglomus occultum]|uniref:3522_t:CDS:1 n=1 Tax=Paraglomus occultum TaxID=144539 RepID=A0A9N9F328_9GLOM|nr:3522_t:CDS:2 [Paraglomus occultum]
MSQRPFQAWQSQPWSYQQEEETMQEQQHQQQRHTLLNPSASITYQPMRPEYMGDSTHYLYQDLLNSQKEMEWRRQFPQDQSLLSLSQSPTDINMLTSSGLPTYFIPQMTNKQQTPTYIDNSIQQPNGTLFPQQNLFTLQQPHQQRWLSHLGQHEEQKPNETTMPMQSDHKLSRQNSVQDMVGVALIEPLEYAQLQRTQIIPRPAPSKVNVYQQVSLLQSNIDQSGNGFSHQFSQVEINEQPSQSQ